MTGRAPDGVRIRAATPADFDGVTAIYNHYIETSHVTFDTRSCSADERAPWFCQFGPDGPYRLFVAERDATVVGWASSTRLRPKPAYDSSVETTIYLDPAATGRGVGQALYDRLLAELEAVGVHRAYAGIALPNPTSVVFHERYGYRRVGRFHEVGFKFERYWDVAWYERPFQPAVFTDSDPGV